MSALDGEIRGGEDIIALFLIEKGGRPAQAARAAVGQGNGGSDG
jgi:hypothetical protein